jgi:putative tRNA adenosine deaminase-associated protein
VAYFTAVLSPEGSGDDRDWRTVEIDLEAGSPDELGDALRGAVDDDDAPVLAVLEREDEWFALVRTDGALDVRVFVSDAVAAAEGGSDDGSDGSGVDDDQPEPEEDEVPAARSETGVLEDVWAGDPELLADLGCPAEVLVRLAGSGADPSAATVEIGEVLGFADVLESLR